MGLRGGGARSADQRWLSPWNPPITVAKGRGGTKGELRAWKREEESGLSSPWAADELRGLGLPDGCEAMHSV